MSRSMPYVLLLAAIGPACAFPATSLAEDVLHKEDIVYGRSYPEGAAPFDLVMDAYLPAKPDATPRPALMFFHGNPGNRPFPGARQHGFGTHAEYFVRHGYAVFVVAYPFFGDVEAKAAVRHVRAKAAEYNVSPDRIAALGHSLGSNLSMRLAVTGEDNAKPNAQEQADPLNHWGTSARVNAAIPVGGGNGPHPIDELDKNDSPLCFVHGTADDVAPIVNALERRRLTQRANIPNAFLRVEGLGHSVPAPDAVVAFGKTFGEFIDAFLRIHMRGQPPENWVALQVTTDCDVDIVLEPEHGLYLKGQEVKITAIPRHDGVASPQKTSDIAALTTTVIMDSTKGIPFPFTATTSTTPSQE